MALEKFHSTKGKPAKAPAISIQASGVIRLNVDIVQIFRSEKVTHVVLFWDKEKHRLAIVPDATGDQAAYRVTYGKTGNIAGIGAKAFAKHIGWCSERSARILVKMSEGRIEATVPSEYLSPTDVSSKTRRKKPDLARN
jgi:hypothetical protein